MKKKKKKMYMPPRIMSIVMENEYALLVPFTGESRLEDIDTMDRSFEDIDMEEEM